MTPPIHFFIPPNLWPKELPTSPDHNWAGYCLGMYTWTVQTALRLKAAGVACQLTHQLPEEGIILCHSNALRTIEIPPTPSRLLICIKAEAPVSAIAPLHIVQNPSEASTADNRYFIPHWPQPQLIPRDASRGDRFETLAFFGHENSLEIELRSPAWQAALSERGLRWRIVANTNHWNNYSTLDSQWNDYSKVDVIVAVRSFKPWQQLLTNHFSHKPATKLYNAWLGGAIAILGAESAYRQTGNPGQDYVEVSSFNGLLDSLERLQADATWRRSIITQGVLQSKAYTADKIVHQWQEFFESVAIPAYEQWRSSSSQQHQKALLSARYANYQDRLLRKGRHFLSKALPV